MSKLREISAIGAVSGVGKELFEFRPPACVGGGLRLELGNLARGKQGNADQGVLPATGPGMMRRAEENTGQGVVVLGGDRVELVIVTAGTGDGEPQKRATDDIDLVVDVIGDHLVLIDVAGHEIRDGQQSRGDQAVLVEAAGTR